jgi:hypothetical protein
MADPYELRRPYASQRAKTDADLAHVDRDLSPRVPWWCVVVGAIIVVLCGLAAAFGIDEP